MAGSMRHEALVVRSLPERCRKILLLKTAPDELHARYRDALASCGCDVREAGAPHGLPWGAWSLSSAALRLAIRDCDAIASGSISGTGVYLRQARILALAARKPHFTLTPSGALLAWNAAAKRPEPPVESGRIRVAYDARILATYGHGGIPALIREFLKRLSRSERYEFWVLIASAEPPDDLADLPCRWFPIWAPEGHRNERALLREAVEFIRPKMYHAFFGDLPHRCPVPIVAMIYDTTQHDLPEEFPGSRQARHEEARARRGDVVLSISRATADNVARNWDVDPNRIMLAPPAADYGGALPDPTDLATARSWLLFSHYTARYKNASVVIDACSRLAPEGRSLPAVKIVGRLPEPDRGRIAAAIEKGSVDRARMEELWRDTRLFIAPSRAEGFDMPALDALARGIPVVASDIPVHREVLGAEAEYFDPASAAALARILRAHLDPRAEDHGASDRRRALARRYSWNRSANVVLEAYDRILRGEQVEKPPPA